MPRKIVILLLIIFIGGLLFPVLTLAGKYQGYDKTIYYEGLVPCGKSKVSISTESPTGKESDEVKKPCEFCHLFVMLDGIIDFVTQKILPSIVVLMMVIAGIMFFFAGGNPALLLQAKKLITSVVIGVVIIFSAYLIVGTVLTMVGVQDWTTLDTWLSPQGVFIVNCPIGEDEAPTTPITPTPPTVPASDYTTKDECEEAGYYWYDGECHEEEEEGEWISENTDTSADNIKVLDLSCSDGTKLEGEGICEALGQTDIKEDEPYGDNGWYCKFKGRGGGSAKGKLSIYCVPEVIANLSYTPIRTGDGSVATEVNSVPSSQTVTGDDVYSITAEEEVNFPVSITLSYTDEWVTEAGLDENILTIYRYDETLSRWVGLPSTVDTMNNTVTALTDHLSIFAIMGRKATVTDCECTSGLCCDGCHYYGTDHKCSIKVEEKHKCISETNCGGDVGVKFRDKIQYCNGKSAECNGNIEFGLWNDDWTTFTIDCDKNQICKNGNCEYSKECGCQCLEGDNCCSDGCHYDADETVCNLRDTSGCMLCEWGSGNICGRIVMGENIMKVSTCDNGGCLFARYEKGVCFCARSTTGYICATSPVTCKQDAVRCANCTDNYCKKVIQHKCNSSGECDMSNPIPFFWGECCYPDAAKECNPGTTCCTDEGYYEAKETICQEYDWEDCAGGEYTSECDNMKIGSQVKKTMACTRTGGCNLNLPWEYRDCAITRNTAGLSCDEGAGYCENGKCVHYSNMVCTPGTSCCDSDGQYKPKSTRCYTDYSWGTCITDWDTSSDCQESITGTKYKNHKVCNAFGSCSVNDKETTSCTDTRDTDGDECGSGKHCKNGKCLTDEPVYGDECNPLSICCTSGGYYKASGTRCYTDTSWSSCKSCDYHGSCDEKADGEKKKTHKNCDGSDYCSVLDVEKKDCTCTRNTDGKKCSSSSKNCYCSSGRCYCPGGH